MANVVGASRDPLPPARMIPRLEFKGLFFPGSQIPVAVFTDGNAEQ